MLLTSAADSTAGGGLHGGPKFPGSQFDYSHIVGGSGPLGGSAPATTSATGTHPDSAFVSPNIEVNIAEVSSTTDIAVTPKSEGENLLKCNVGGNYTMSHGTVIKPEPGQVTAHSPGFGEAPSSLFPGNQFTFYQQTAAAAAAGSTSNPYHYGGNPHGTMPPTSDYNHHHHHHLAAAAAGLSPLDIFNANSTTAPHPMGFHTSSQHLSNLISLPGAPEDVKPSLPAHCHEAVFRSHHGNVAMAAARVRAASARTVFSNPLEEEVISQQRANRRQMHKICEQKRRDGLKSALETLKMTIPGCSILSDQSQQNILLKAYQFVCDLLRKQQSNKVIIEELQSIKEKNTMLQAEIEYFKKEYKKLSALGDPIGNPQKPTSTTDIPDRGVIVT